MKIRVGTRKSRLALQQTKEVTDALLKIDESLEIEIVKLETKGDKIHHKPLRDVYEGGKLAFTSELQKALENNEIDIAVHSLKDVAGNFNPKTTQITSYLERKSPYDLLITKSHEFDNLENLPVGFVIGTVSLRRRLFIQKANSTITVKNLRGNIETRIAKLNGEHVWQGHTEIRYDGIIMAEAAIQRNNIDTRNLKVTPITKTQMVPAACQGTICVESRKADRVLYDLLRKINHPETEILSKAERGFLEKLNGNCHTAIGVIAELIDSNKLQITAEIFDEESLESWNINMSSNLDKPKNSGYEAALALKNNIILERGAEYLENKIKVEY